MHSRRVLVFSILLTGVLAPLTPRLVLAFVDEEAGKLFAPWILQSFRWPGIGDWAFVLSPAVLLALFASVLLRRGVAEPLRVPRARRLWATTAITYLLGLYCCKPALGQGMAFYLGELIFPFLALPVIALAYGMGCLIWRRTDPSADLPDDWSPAPDASRSSPRPAAMRHSRDR